MCIFRGDILDKKILANAVKNSDYVFHLVARTHDLVSEKDKTEDYFRVNVEGTRNLLEVCIKYKIKHFVYFSSVTTMADKSEYALDETFNSHPNTAYGKSKLIAERMVLRYGNKYGFKTTILRLPLVYGPGNKGNIYRMIKAIDNGRFVMMGKGLNVRSMVHVCNAVDAAMAVIGQEVADSKVYLITDDVNYTVRDLYRIIAKGLGKKPIPFYVPIGIARILAIIGDVGSKKTRTPWPFDSEILEKLSSSLTFSSRRIQEDIGFKPKNNFYNTIDETIRWYKRK